MSNLEPSLSSADTSGQEEIETIKILVENEVLAIPKELICNDVFFDVVSSSTFDSLTPSSKTRLQKLLPANLTSKELPNFLGNLFNVDMNIGFTNPIKKFQENLQSGSYNLEYVGKFGEIQKCLQMQHKIRLRDHYARLLKVLLIRRRKLIESSLKCVQGEKIPHSWESSKIYHKKDKLKRRSLKRAKIILNSVKSQVGEHNLSSDDDDVAALPKDLQINLVSKHGSNTSTSNDDQQYSTLYNPNFPDLDLNQPSEITDIKVLLAEFKMLRKSDPDHPSLEFSDITLDDVTERTGLQLPAPKQQPVKKILVQHSPSVSK